MIGISNKIINIIALIFSFLVITLDSNSQNIEAIAKIENNNITIGDQVKLIISVKYPASYNKYRLDWPLLKDTIIGKIEIVGIPDIDTIVSENDSSTIEQKQIFTITSFDSGFYTIPPFNIYLINGKDSIMFFTNPLLLTVNTIKTENPMPGDTIFKAIKAIKPPLGAPLTFWDVLPWILGCLLFAIIVALIIYFIKYRKKMPIENIIRKPKLPPHQIAFDKLNELNEKKLWQQGKVKLFHIELTDILRTYIEERFSINAMEQITNEILESIKRTDVSEDTKDKLRQILILADFVKFAKAQPLANENELSMKYAYEFVEATKQIRIDKEEENGNNKL